MQVRRFARAGLTLTADVGGDPLDPPVLLLHGAGESRHVWGAVGRALVAAGRYVVSLDLRGHSDSDVASDGDYTLDAYVADIRTVLGGLGDPAAIIGHRLGGIVALATAHAVAPGAIAALALIDVGFGHNGDERERERALLMSATEGFDGLDEALARVVPHRPLLGSQAMLRHLLRESSDGRWRWRHDPLAVSGPVEHRVDLVRDEKRIRVAADSLRVPTLLIRTGASALLAPADAERMKRSIATLEFADLAAPGGTPVTRDVMTGTLREFLDRSMPRRADAAPRRGIDPLTLRQALGCFATGVTIVTATSADGTPVGLTANSFCSVSLDPPLVLFCIDRRCGSLSVFEECNSFAINVLNSNQQSLSDIFVKKGVDRFANTGWETWEAAAPIVHDSMASFECDKHQVLDGGDHRIFIGRVREVWFDPARDPLLYFQGKYRQVRVPQQSTRREGL